MILRSMRSGFLSAFFLALLVMGGFSLMLTDWNGFFRNGVTKTDVAKVDGVPIKIAEFNSRATQILRQQHIDSKDAYNTGMIDMILQTEITDMLIKKNAADLGIRVENRLLADQIKDMIAPLKTGAMTDKDALQRFLEMQGMNEKQLATRLRDDITSRILKTTVTAGTYVPAALTEGLLAYRGETRAVDVKFYPDADVPAKPVPNDKELEAYYNGISGDYKLPETRDVTFAVIDTSKIAKPTITDTDIKAAYDANIEHMKLPKSAAVEQALFSDKGTADKAYKAVLSGKSLKESVTEATGNEKAYQGKTSFSKDAIPAVIADPVFAAKPGTQLAPIQSPLGYHLIRLEGITPERTIAFDEVKEKIRKDLTDEKSADAIYDVTGKIEDRLANGETYETVKDSTSMTVLSAKGLTADTAKDSPSLAFAGDSASKLAAKIFTLAENTPSEMIDIGNNKLASVRVDKLRASTPKDFADVKAEISARKVKDTQHEDNIAAVQKRADDINAGKMTFEGLKPEKIAALARNEKAENAPLPADVVDRVMNAAKGTAIVVISKEKKGVYIARVSAITLPKTNGKTDDALASQLKSDMADAAYLDYISALQMHYPVSINDTLLKRVYGRQDEEE